MRFAANSQRHRYGCIENKRCPLLADVGLCVEYVRFSNRPVWVKRFQTIRRYSVDVAHGLVLLSGIGARALPSWGSRTRRRTLQVLAVLPRDLSANAANSRYSETPHKLVPPGRYGSRRCPGPFGHGSVAFRARERSSLVIDRFVLNLSKTHWRAALKACRVFAVNQFRRQTSLRHAPIVLARRRGGRTGAPRGFSSLTVFLEASPTQ